MATACPDLEEVDGVWIEGQRVILTDGPGDTGRGPGETGRGPGDTGRGPGELGRGPGTRGEAGERLRGPGTRGEAGERLRGPGTRGEAGERLRGPGTRGEAGERLRGPGTQGEAGEIESMTAGGRGEVDRTVDRSGTWPARRPIHTNGAVPSHPGQAHTSHPGQAPTLHRFSFMRPPGPERLTELPVRGTISSLKLEHNKLTGRKCIYVITDRKPSLTRYRINADVLNKFGSGQGGVALDPHSARDCVCITSGSYIRRYYRDGSDLEMGYPTILNIKGTKNLTDILCIPDAPYLKTKEIEVIEKVNYVAVDNDLECVFVIDPRKSKIKLRIPDAKKDQFKPGCIAFSPKFSPKSGALVVTSENEVRMYSMKGRLLSSIRQDLERPSGVCVDDNSRIVVCNTGRRQVLRFSRDTGDNWKSEVLLTEKELETRLPCHVDITDGHMILAVRSEDGSESFWQTYKYD